MNFLKSFFIIFLGILQVFLFLYFFERYVEILVKSPFDPNSKANFVFEIKRGESLSEISKRLKKEGLIKSSFWFDFYVKRANKENSLKAGKYLFSPNMSISEIASKIIFGDVFLDLVYLQIPEGFTLSDISKRAKQKGISGKDITKFTVEDFKDKYSFLANIPEDASLEGFLFPDTYKYEKDKVNTEVVVKSMLDNFDKKFTKKMREDARVKGKSIYEIVIMASILEKEVKTKEDMKLASGVLWRRIELDMPLQVDATSIYQKEEGTSTAQAIRQDNPYNTYLNKGLPKGPISNPGLSALEAALYPEKSNYLFYLSKPNGETVFSETYKEHLEAINKFLR